jgi:septum formation protein
VNEEKTLILASASPRRSELLTQLGVSYRKDVADIDESPLQAELPKDYVIRMACEKAATVAARHSLTGNWILAADTIVEIEGDILGKPTDFFDGLAILARLSGRKHKVMTAICLHGEAGAVPQLVETEVQFVQLSREVCESYLATEEPWDKAGAYGIQGLGGALVSSIHGSYSNVVGLPLRETWQLLSAHGIDTRLERGGE